MYFYSMIQANELRRFSLIQFDDDGSEIVFVNHLSYSAGSWFVHWHLAKGNDNSFQSGNSLLEDFIPIPLTPEILEQCGFEKISADVYRCNYFDIHFDEERYWFETKAGEVVRETEIEALHQLQNLYWCVCGEDIEIKQLATA